MNPRIAELVTAYRERESDDRRGPLFKEVALAIESEIESGAMTKDTILACLGPPDLFEDDVYVYRFDHEQPGDNNHEWYFHFENGRLRSSGYNIHGINDLSSMKDRSQFPTKTD